MTFSDREMEQTRSTNLPEVIALLERLVAFDTQNPPRHVDSGGIFAFLVEALGPSFQCTIEDLGEGCVSLLAVRGAPKLLFNVHMDTVPAPPGQVAHPFALRVEGDRAIGLGACDIKGAAACLITAAHRASEADVAILFTSDEEAGSSRCIRSFLAKPHGFTAVVVAEPTRCRAVLEHRGIATSSATFWGVPGHGSAARALEDSALHEAVRWATRALAFAEERTLRRHKNLEGIRFNLGTLNGGTKANVIAAEATLRFGVRPLPGESGLELLEDLARLAPHPDRATFTPGFLAPSLPAPGHKPAQALAIELGLKQGPAVDFWTEAALFSEAGIPVLVYGPGDIAQAHSEGEWVALAELAEAAATYERIFSR